MLKSIIKLKQNTIRQKKLKLENSLEIDRKAARLRHLQHISEFAYGAADICCNCHRKFTRLMLPCRKEKSISWAFKCKCAQIGIWYCLIQFCVGSNRITFIYLIFEPRNSFCMKNSFLKLQHSSALHKLLTSWRQRFLVDGTSLCWHALFALKCWYHECIKKTLYCSIIHQYVLPIFLLLVINLMIDMHLSDGFNETRACVSQFACLWDHRVRIKLPKTKSLSTRVRERVCSFYAFIFIIWWWQIWFIEC